MDAQILFTGAILLLLFTAWYSTASKRNKILCNFSRRNKTVIEKFVPQSSRYVVFDKGRYKVDTKRIQLFWYTRGINQYFPMFVPYLQYSFYSDMPHDPDDYQDTWDTPEGELAASGEDDWKGFNRATQSINSKSVTGMKKWLPYILAVAAGLVVYFLVVK